MKSLFVPVFLIFGFTGAKVQQGQVIQFNINKLLNARPVTVVATDQLLTWTRGIDGNGMADGYLTLSAALFNGDKNPHALPDNPLFAGNEFHPKIKLHYSNSGSNHNQACAISSAGEVEFNVPKGKYSSIFLSFTSAEGPSAIKVRLEYEQDTTTTDFIVPDYYQDIKQGNSNLSYLAHDLAKWGNKNNMAEKDHHNIDLLKIAPNPAWKLKSIRISKTRSGYLVFWAATGVKN
jgi:hypothetical protein